MTKLMAIDGNSLINRAFYGVRQLSTQSGVPTNAVYGFLNMYLKLLEDEKPDGVCVCFDLPKKSFRHDMFDGYKAQRKPMPDELGQQIPLLKELLDLMGVPRLEKEGFEADDLLGTLARICREDGDSCVIVTGDKDSLQFLSEGAAVRLVSTRMGQTIAENYDEAHFKEVYQGLTPDKIVDLKALMGDASDNIPGVKGIGEKGAMELLCRFGSLKEVYRNLDDPGITASVKRKLEEGREMAELSYRLALGETLVPIGERAEALRLRKMNEPGLYEFLNRLEMRTAIKRLGLSPGQSEKTKGFTPGPVTELARWEELRGRIGNGPVCCAMPRELGAVAVTADGGTFVLTETGLGEQAFSSALGELFSGGYPLVLHDAKPVFTALASRGSNPRGLAFDTALAAYLLDPTAGGYTLAGCAAKTLGWEQDLPDVDGAGAFSPLGAAEEEIRGLGVRSALIAALYETYAAELQKTEMDRLFREVELPLVSVLARMERLGMGVDKARLLSFGETLQSGMEELEASIYMLAGEIFNIGSPKQLGAILFDRLRLKAYKKTKTGYSTSVDVLEKLRGQHEIIDRILSYRQLSKLKSTYVDGLSKVIAPDGRIHSTFNQTVTATGRLSSTEPNLQNIPIRRQLGGEIRRCFVPREGWVFLDADYSQIELRILAHIADDPAMQAAFVNGEDIHTVTASQVFGVPMAEVTSQQRSRAKAVNFGIVYGISAYSLSEDIHVPPKQAQSYIDAYLQHYAGVRSYMEEIKRKAKEQGYVTTLMGRRRYLPELKSGDFNVRSFGERVALNTPIQGTAADIIKLAMIRVDRRLREEGLEARLALQVHDELIVEAPPKEVEQAAALLRYEMEHAMQLKVALLADVSWGENWYDAKK